jgi:hypothetical protein
MKTFFNKVISLLTIIYIFPMGIIFSQNFISYTMPTQNQLHISRYTQIIVGFNETILDSSLNNNSVVAYGTLSGRHFGDIVYDSTDKKMVYTPLKFFASGERVFVSLTNEIRSTSGDTLLPAYSFGFNVKSDTGFNTITCNKYQEIAGLNTIEDMKVADLDDDDDYDIIFCSNGNQPSTWKIITFINDGLANFQQFFEFDLDERPRLLAPGDYNNDGIQDFAVATDNYIKLIRTSANGQLYDYGLVDLYYSGIIASGDFNNDGKIDLLGLEFDDSVYPDEKRIICFIKNIGDGNFEKVYSYEFLSSHTETSFYADLADLNNDGFIDLALSRIFSNQVHFLINDGVGNFSVETIKYFDNSTPSLALGDFNSDSNVDAAISTGESGWNGLKIFKNYGNGVFVYFYSTYNHSHPWVTLSTDFNNDGNLDLTAPFAYGHRIAVYRGSGDLFFDNILQIDLNPSSNPYLLDIADFDGDGDVDIIVLNNGSNGRKLYFLQNGPNITSIEKEPSTQINFSLSQNYPNPFNPVTKIKYSIPSVTLRQAQSDILVTLKVYDILGREVATLINDEKPAGEYEVEFDAANFPSGIYFYQLKAGNFVETKKLVLLK